MKKIIHILLLFTSLYSNAQVTIGKNSFDGSGILDFAAELKGGIVLPRVTNMPNQAKAQTNGTLLVNAEDPSNIKVLARANGSWIALTDSKNLPNTDINTAEDVKSGVIIGSITTTASGVLVLESTNQALILPKVSDITIYRNAVVGTLFYDLATKSLAVYDGSKWILWR